MTADGPPASGSLPQLAPPSLVGQVLDGRYRITRKIGEGGMGEVYAAEHIHIDKKFAIKLLRPEIVSNAEAVTRFQQEARSSSGIKHRNIIAIDDFGTLADGGIFMCMELLNGAALNDLITQPMAIDRLLNILIQTGHGLAAAHAKNIVHRDMKPENIFVTIGPNGEDIPKILDFGIAKVSGNDGQNHLTRTGTIFGTPFYMAPEQALGNPVDARTDIYAMGVIMYEVFSASRPFQGESFMGILTQHITTEPEPVAQRAAKAGRQLPPGLAEIVTRAMQKDPARRFGSMDELVNALVQIYRGVAGPGMSTYMEAFPPSAGHQVQHTPPPTVGMPIGPGAPLNAQSATVAVVGASGPHGMMPLPPTQMPPAHLPPTQMPPMHLPPTQMPGAASSAVAIVPRKSKAGVIIAIVAVLLVGGGVAAVVATSSHGSSAPVGSDGSSGSNAIVVGSDHKGPEIGSNVVVGSDHVGSNAVGSNAVGSNAVGSNAVGSDHVAVGSDHGQELPLPPDAGVVAVAPSDTVSVPLFAHNGASFEVWENGKKLMDGDTLQNLDVPKGGKRVVVIKAKGFRDKTVTVDASKKKLQFTLDRIPGPGPGPGPGSGSAHDPGTGSGHELLVPVPTPPMNCSKKLIDSHSKACRDQYCKTHPDESPFCTLE